MEAKKIYETDPYLLPFKDKIDVRQEQADGYVHPFRHH